MEDFSTDSKILMLIYKRELKYHKIQKYPSTLTKKSVQNKPEKFLSTSIRVIISR